MGGCVKLIENDEGQAEHIKNKQINYRGTQISPLFFLNNRQKNIQGITY